MSKEVLLQTVDKALKDTRFRSMLLRDPKRTLSGLSLTQEEYSALTQLTNESFDFISENLDRDARVGALDCFLASLARDKEATLSRYNLMDYYDLTSN